MVLGVYFLKAVELIIVVNYVGKLEEIKTILRVPTQIHLKLVG